MGKHHVFTCQQGRQFINLGHYYSLRFPTPSSTASTTDTSTASFNLSPSSENAPTQKNSPNVQDTPRSSVQPPRTVTERPCPCKMLESCDEDFLSPLCQSKKCKSSSL